MAAIDTDNLSDDFVNNMAKIFDGNMKSLGLKEVYKDDIFLVPIVPSLAIAPASFFNDVRSVGSTNVRYTLDIIGELWYYHSSVSPDVTKKMVMGNAWKIMKFIMEKASLNGFLTNTRAVVRTCAYTPRLRAGSLMASARLIVLAPYLLTIDEIT